MHFIIQLSLGFPQNIYSFEVLVLWVLHVLFNYAFILLRMLSQGFWLNLHTSLMFIWAKYENRFFVTSLGIPVLHTSLIGTCMTWWVEDELMLVDDEFQTQFIWEVIRYIKLLIYFIGM